MNNMSWIRQQGPLSAAAGGLLTALLVAVVYWPARWNGFVWDDWLPLVQTPVFRNPALWWEGMLTAPLGDPAATRPIAMLSFMLQFWAGQSDPAPFHVANVMIHAANVFLLVVLVRHILGESYSRPKAVLAAVASGLVYGLHPALTESVLWISCRYDLLMTFFLLLALVLDRMLDAAGWTRAVLVGIAFIFGVLSKETAVSFILALPFLHLAMDHLQGRPLDRAAPAAILASHYKVYVALFAVSVLYLWARFVLFGASIGMRRMALQFEDIQSWPQRALAVAASLAQHVSDAFWPFRDLIPSRSLELPISAGEVFPVIAMSACLFVAAMLAARSAPPAGRLVALLFLAFLAALIPVSNILPLPGRWGQIWVSSRYLTFPLALICLGIPFAYRVADGLLAKHLESRKWVLAGVAVAWMVASAANVRAIIPLWQNEHTLGVWAIQQGAKDYWRYQNLGEYHLHAHATQEARNVFLAAVKLRGDIASSWYYLGFAEALLDNREQAAKAFRRALELDPDIIAARINLAKLDLEAGNPQAAAAVLERGLARLHAVDEPDQAGVLHFTLGRAYAALGRDDDAVAQMETALKLAQNPQERAAALAALKSISRPR